MLAHPLEDPYRAPGCDVQQEDRDLRGRKVGFIWMGALSSLLLFAVFTLLMVEQWAGRNPHGRAWDHVVNLLRLAFELLPGLMLGGWLGHRLERGGFWRGLGWALLAGLLWGPSSFLMLYVFNAFDRMVRYQIIELSPILGPDAWSRLRFMTLAGFTLLTPTAVGIGLQLRSRRRERNAAR